MNNFVNLQIECFSLSQMSNDKFAMAGRYHNPTEPNR